MLNTLRNLINNDSIWFSILQGIQARFAYQTVTTDDIVHYINESTKTDYSYFFDQYLRHAAIPELQLKLMKEADILNVQYRWKADLEKFNMPIKVTVSKNDFDFIYPTTDWKNIDLPNMKVKDFRVDRDGFYIQVKIE